MSKKSMLRDTDKDIVKVEVLDGGGFKTECSNPDGTGWGTTFYGMITYENLQNLEGKMLTIADAAFSDKEQRKAIKDIIRRTFWFDWVENCVYKGKDTMPVGMPNIQ
jgi:hypothetical protein